MGCAPSSLPVGARGGTSRVGPPHHAAGRRLARSDEGQLPEAAGPDSSARDWHHTARSPQQHPITFHGAFASDRPREAGDRAPQQFTHGVMPIDAPMFLSAQGSSSVFGEEEEDMEEWEEAQKVPVAQQQQEEEKLQEDFSSQGAVSQSSPSPFPTPSNCGHSLSSPLSQSPQPPHPLAQGRAPSMTAVQKVNSLQSCCSGWSSSGDPLHCITTSDNVTATASSALGPRDGNPSNSQLQQHRSITGRLSKSDVSLSVEKTEASAPAFSISLPVFHEPTMPMLETSPRTGLISAAKHSSSRSESSVWDLGIQSNLGGNLDEQQQQHSCSQQPSSFSVAFPKVSPTISNRSRRSLEPFPTPAEAAMLLQSRTSAKLVSWQDSQEGEWEEDSFRRRSSGFSVSEPLDPQWWLHYIRQRSA